MTHVFDIIMVPLQIIIFLFTIYYFVIGFCGMWRRKEKKILTPQKSFAVIFVVHIDIDVIVMLITVLRWNGCLKSCSQWNGNMMV